MKGWGFVYGVVAVFSLKNIENELPRMARKPAVLFQLRFIDVLYQYC
jgi:hypothetical protein